MEIVCLDTDILIEHKRAKQQNKSKTRLYKLAAKGYKFAVTSITAYELLRGDNSDEDIFWKSFFEKVSKYDFDFNAAKIAGNIYRDLKARGEMVNIEDILIASIAMKYKIALASNNKKHLERIKGLNLIN